MIKPFQLSTNPVILVKIGPVDPEIMWLKLKKKITQAKYTAQSASLRSGLNYNACTEINVSDKNGAKHCQFRYTIVIAV